MTVWIKETGHWTDSNPGFEDHWIQEGFDVRNYPFTGAKEYKVKTNAS